MILSSIKKICVAVLSFLMLSSCGYQLVQEKGIFGGDVKSIYVSVFKNKTYEPHTSMYFTDAFTRELVSAGLFQINKEGSDAYIEGVIQNLTIVPSTMNKDGIVIEKKITIDVELTLFGKDGSLIKKWRLSDFDTYRVDNINYEDYNKRETLKKISGRMARRFCSFILVDY